MSRKPHLKNGILQADLCIIGAGSGGLSVAAGAAQMGAAVVLVEKHLMGGDCLNTGCVPSKALLAAAHAAQAQRSGGRFGVAPVEPRVDFVQVMAHVHGVIGAIAPHDSVARFEGLGCTIIQAAARFTGPGEVEAGGQRIAARRFIIATGSRAIRLPGAPDDPRILDSTSALALQDIPTRLLVIGGGIIGLEMATVYAGLGSAVDVVEAGPELMPGADRDLVKVWEAINRPLLGEVRLSTRVTNVVAERKGIRVSLQGAGGPQQPAPYDRVLVAIGRRPDSAGLGLEAAGLAPDARGFIAVDSQMRTALTHIFAIGDVVGQPMLAHKAVHQGHVAAEAAAGQPSHFDARVIPSVAYTDPEIAWVGVTEAEARASGRAVKRGVFPWAASGRALASGAEAGLTRLLFDAADGRCIGGGIVGAHAGDLIGEVCLAIEMGANATDIGATIHPHPTFGESIGMAAESALGHCTDLPPVRRAGSG